jgi:hypothetical protein
VGFGHPAQITPKPAAHFQQRPGRQPLAGRAGGHDPGRRHLLRLLQKRLEGGRRHTRLVVTGKPFAIVMMIIVLWALFFARLAYSALGYIAPGLFSSSEFIVFMAVPAVVSGVWIGAKVYDAWPESYKTIEHPASARAIMIAAAIALPLFYLLWRLLVMLPSVGLVAGLALTLIPCALKLVSRDTPEN